MTKRRPRVTGRDATGAGALMLATNAICAALGAGIGRLVGAIVALAVARFFLSFYLGI